MAQIKPETYTEELKAYLTYPPDIRIIPHLLDEQIKEKYMCTLPNKSKIIADKFGEDLRKELESIGATFNKEKILKREGKKLIFGVPVEVRQIKKLIGNTGKSNLEEVRVRITGKNLDQLHRNKDKIIAGLASYGVVYTECIWISEIPEPTKKETKPQKIKPEEKRIQKLTNIVEDLRDDVENLKKPSIKKRIEEENKVKVGVLR